VKVLVTGGAGYIGSNVALALVEAGHQVCIFDLVGAESSPVAAEIESLTGVRVDHVTGDVRDLDSLRAVLSRGDFDACIHLAGLKSVGESHSKPIEYYWTNVTGTAFLVQAMIEAGVESLVFSSSATVYGEPQGCPIAESHPTGQGLTNPYGRSKFMAEEILRDAASAHVALKVTALRYFNPVGAHSSGLLAERPTGQPTNIAPVILEAALGIREHLDVYGADYPTRDGTGVRDYIHVSDLARGHVAAIESAANGWRAINLGTGDGTSVLELIDYFTSVSGLPVPVQIKPRRAGDVAVCFSDPSLAARELGWTAELSVEKACHDAWSARSGELRRS